MSSVTLYWPWSQLVQTTEVLLEQVKTTPQYKDFIKINFLYTNTDMGSKNIFKKFVMWTVNKILKSR